MENAQIKAIVVSVSDTRTEENDISGVTLVGLLLGINAIVEEKIIVSDDFDDLRQTFFFLTGRDDINLVITGLPL